MKQILSILSLLFFVSCGAPLDHRVIDTEGLDGTGQKDPELSRFLERFEEDMGVEIPYHLSINVVDKLQNINDTNVDAVCWTTVITGVGERIEIKRSRWEQLSESGKEQLLYHELGHCVLYKGHVTGVKEDPICPKSIMNPYTFTRDQLETCYEPELGHEEYLNELAH